MKNNAHTVPDVYFWRKSYSLKAMWRAVGIIIIIMASCQEITLKAQNHEPVLTFLGTDNPEELSPYDVERLEDFLTHPLKLNYVSESKLEESGLFSHYQAVSLSDYRSRHGDLLSFSELSAVDGFGHEFVAKLRPFVSLESNRLPGAAARPVINHDISIRSAIRKGSSMTYGLKYRLTAGERLTGGISISRTSEALKASPDAFSGHLAIHLKRRSGKILIGDFNARFGQGLSLWNGMSFNGLTSASSFIRKPSSISSSSSFTGGYALRGAAADIRLGRTRISVMTAVANDKDSLSILPALNLSWFMRHGQISMTHYADFNSDPYSTYIKDMKTSVDMAYCIRGTDLFTEVAYDWVSSKPAALAGLSAPAGENIRFAYMLRYYPSMYSSHRSAAARSTTVCSNEYAASLAMDFSAGGWMNINGASGFGTSVRRHVGSASLDCAYFPMSKVSDAMMKSIQVKARAEWTFMISGAFRSVIRLSERIRTWGEPFRTDIRADFSYISRAIVVNFRTNTLFCKGLGLLAYAEEGYRSERLSVYFRQGVFRVDNWADRIYVYERDAPGSYNVPAYYGRGVWAALTMNWKFARWGRVYVRGAVTAYPFMAEKKPGRAELKFQSVFTL